MSSVEPEAPAATDDSLADPAAADVAEAAPEDDANRAVLDALKTELGAALVDSLVQRGELWVRVEASQWGLAGRVLRNQLGFDYFCFLSGIDWMPHTWPNPKVVEGDGAESDGAEEDAEPEPDPAAAGGPGNWQTGVTGGATRFQVLARVYSLARRQGILLKADLDDDAPQIESWHTIYPGADWHERETWEMYGFDFVGHPNLIHLYLPGAFEGFPLRKDFPLLSREVKPWPGLVDVEQFPASYKGDEDVAADAAAATTEGDAG